MSEMWEKTTDAERLRSKMQMKKQLLDEQKKKEQETALHRSFQVLYQETIPKADLEADKGNGSLSGIFIFHHHDEDGRDAAEEMDTMRRYIQFFKERGFNAFPKITPEPGQMYRREIEISW